MSIIERCHDRWADLHPFGRFLAVIALVGSITLIAGPPALELYRDWRDDGRLRDAKKAVETGQNAEARELTLSVLRRDGANKEGLSTLLRATRALNDPRRANVAMAVLADASRPPEERLFAWQVACESSPAWILQASWSVLDGQEQSNPAFVAPLSDRLVRDRMNTEAAMLLARLPQPLPPELDQRLMQLLIAKGTDEAFEEFQRHLIGRLPELPPDAAVVSFLDDLPQSSLRPGLFRALRLWQEKHATTGPDASLRLARCQIAAEPDRADAIFGETFGRYRETEPLATARWCFQLRRLTAAKEILAALHSAQSAEAFRLHSLVLEQLGELEPWSELLATPPIGIPPAWASCELAYVAQLRKEPKAHDAASDAAFRAASNAPAGDDLIHLARQATERGLTDLSQRAWVEAIRRSSGPLPLSSSINGVIENLAASKKETELLEVLMAYRILEPGNPVIIVQHDYLACLNGRLSPESLIANLQPIHEKLPDALPVSCALALGNLLTGQPAEALKLTDKDIDWFAASPPNRAIRAIALKATDSEDEAGVFLEKFPWEDLLPSERRILRGLVDTAAEK